jgi:transcriptional regulator with XRE-family HTH domain
MERTVLLMTFPTMKEVAAHLDAVRQGQGKTNEQIADLTGISPRQVVAKLKGERPITTGDLNKITTALSITPAQVYTDLA